jgi:membrane protein
MAWVEALFPGFPAWTHMLLQILFWTVAVIAVGFGLAAVYRFAPNRPDAPWVWISPGSASATLLWLLASLGFGLYVARFGNYNATYGSLGGVVVFLTWLYLSAYILLMGGEFNSELERQQAAEAGAPAGDKDPSLGAASRKTPPSRDAPVSPPATAEPPVP